MKNEELLKIKIENVIKANNLRLLKRYEREWIEKATYLNLINYFYYRYFTNEFELFIIKSKQN